jgi:hypothetical protein
MGEFVFGGVPITIRKMPCSTFATRAPTSLLGVSTTIFQTPLFSTTILAIPNFQLQ